MYVYCTCTVPGPQVLSHALSWGSEWGDDGTTCAVCAWTMLADSDMSPVYILPLVLCALVMSYIPAGETPSQGLEEA